MREKETYMGGIADAFDKAYKEGTTLPGRTGFADGPEDPSKRTFMKILGGIMSLPILGRFFNIGEKAAPVVETTSGVPAYFPKLVEKIKLLGDDVTRTNVTKSARSSWYTTTFTEC